MRKEESADLLKKLEEEAMYYSGRGGNNQE